MALPGDGGGTTLALASAVADASAAMARLDQALASHPLRLAFLHRARLEAVRQQAAADGELIDPWHLAAIIEGLRLRMDPMLAIAERGAVFEAARTALVLHQWLVAPDFDQEGGVQSAKALLAAQPASLPPLLAGQAWAPEFWIPAFLRALAREAEAGLDLLLALERAWFAARRAVVSRRKPSHAGAVIDLLAATPVVSATTLAARLGIAVKNAIRLLDELIAADITVEVTHRSRRRLFGLKGLAPLREAVRPPYRPEPGRGPGRPRQMVIAEEAEAPPAPLPPLSPLARREFEYRALEEAMADLDTALRHARLALQARPAENPPAPPRPALPEGGVAR